MSVSDDLDRLLDAHIERARDAVGRAWAEAAQNQNPLPSQPIVYDAPYLVVPAIPYFVSHGTKPHEINAKNGPFLHFFWAKQGRWFRGKKVHHPGYPGNAFLDAAWSSAEVKAVLRRLPYFLFGRGTAQK